MSVTQSLTLTVDNQSYEANFSDVHMVWKSTQSGASYNNNTKTALYFVSKNGGAEEQYSVTYTLPKDSTKTIADVRIRVPHLPNGEGSITVRTRMATGISAGLVEQTKTLVLPEIPREAVLTVGNGTLGVEQTLTVQQKMMDCTYTIKYTCGEASGTICENVFPTGTTNVVKWTPPLDLAFQAPQGTSVDVNFTVVTRFPGSSNTVGRQMSTSAIYNIPASMYPPVAFAVTDLTPCYGTYGAFVQGKSKLNIAIDTYGVYGSWIASCKTEVDGKTYTTVENVQTDLISGSGQLPIKVTVTDSRNRTTVDNSNITVLPYESPKITAITVQRCNADGTLNSEGSYILVKFSASVSALNNKNHATYYVGYKKTTDAEHTAIELTELKNKFTITNATQVVPADPTSSHTIIVTVVDDFGQDRTTTNGMSAKKVWSILKKNGEVVGMAFGKLAEHENCFDIGWPVKFSAGGDTVVEQGEKNGWTYRKWDSGIAECWKILTHNTAIKTAWGSLYYGQATIRQTYPFNFITKPVEQATLTSGSYQAILFPEKDGNGVNGASASACYNVCRPSALGTSSAFYISLSVRGRWK